ncbi:hypothetical protein [Pistricoccus aurantiacus]|uniref:hypothetical protein n=1 Tax=Pistricoccus aurantiacus TaxID=1883414 RepID=UPI00362F5A8A
MTTNSIEYTQIFENQFQDRFSYLTRYVGQETARHRLETFLDEFESRVLDYPESTPLCEEAADLGSTRYHDYVNASLQLRAIYRIDEAGQRILALLFLDTRQSLRQALVQYCLRRD